MTVNAKLVLERTYATGVHNRALQSLTARCGCYFFLALLLAWIAFLTAVVHWPTSILSNKSKVLFTQIVPTGTFDLLRKVITPTHERTFLWVAIIASLWVASSGFSGAIEALNIAFEAGDDRSFWRTRFLAFALTCTSGTLFLLGLAAVLAGPALGAWLAVRQPLSEVLLSAWPYIRWVLPALLILMATEALYFLGPNVKQRLFATVPGAVVAAGSCTGLSVLLAISLRQFANFQIAYVTLGASILLIILWLNWTGLAMLAGAALNLELSKSSARGKLQEKHVASAYTKLGLAD